MLKLLPGDRCVPRRSPGWDYVRYQQVYESDGPIKIYALRFRIDLNNTEFNATLPDIQINLSTTDKTSDTLSTTFADNVGADDLVVYTRGSLELSKRERSVRSNKPQPFRRPDHVDESFPIRSREG